MTTQATAVIIPSPAIKSATMTLFQRAFLDAQIALSAWRAARDAEAQVAHWLIEGRATREELAHYRTRSRAAQVVHQRARAAYRRASERGRSGTGV